MIRWLRTVRYLRASQVASRARLIAQRTVEQRVPRLARRAVARRAPATPPRWPGGFTPLDAQAPPPPHLGDTRLAAYHRHYLDPIWGMTRTDGLAHWHEWQRANPFPRGDAWHPYVASLRTWALCWLDAEPDAVALHAGYVRRHLETDVGGNHLMKNLKAIIGAGVWLGDEALVAAGRRLLQREVGLQILADGGHYERSPSYHCQVLGDLIDIGGLVDVAGLDAATARMRDWLSAMLMPDFDVPLFNDCTLVGRDRIAALLPTTPPRGPLTVLQPSGYVVVKHGRMHAVIDVGPPCPDDLPAHAHADCLSFELAVDGRRAIVDTGTSTYEPGTRRQYERSTAAHNTVELDGKDQTEVWGTFRAARRAYPTLESAIEKPDGAIEVAASHDGYERLHGHPRHRRRFTFTSGRVDVLDEVVGAGTHTATARLHVVRGTPITISAEPAPTRNQVDAATGFGALRSVDVVTSQAAGDVPLRIQTTVSLLDAP